MLQAALQTTAIPHGDRFALPRAGPAARILKLRAWHVPLEQPPALLLKQHAGTTTALRSRAPLPNHPSSADQRNAEEVRVFGTAVEDVSRLGRHDLRTLRHRYAIINIDHAGQDTGERLGGAARQRRATDRCGAKTPYYIGPALPQGTQRVRKMHNRFGRVKDPPVGPHHRIVDKAASNVNSNIEPRLGAVESLISCHFHRDPSEQWWFAYAGLRLLRRTPTPCLSALLRSWLRSVTCEGRAFATDVTHTPVAVTDWAKPVTEISPSCEKTE